MSPDHASFVPHPTPPRPEEVIFTGQIHDHAMRFRSFEIAAEAMADLARKSAAGAARELQALLDCANRPRMAPVRQSEGRGSAALRALAHGAAREVVGGGTSAIDAALDVCLAEIEALQGRLAAQTEVIKLARSYSGDDWLRTMAAAVLEARDVDLARCLPKTLFDPDLADAAPLAPRKPLG